MLGTHWAMQGLARTRRTHHDDAHDSRKRHLQLHVWPHHDRLLSIEIEGIVTAAQAR